MKALPFVLATIIALTMPVVASAHENAQNRNEAAREAAERSNEEMRAAHRLWVERLRILREDSRPTLQSPQVPVFQPRASGG